MGWTPVRTPGCCPGAPSPPLVSAAAARDERHTPHTTLEERDEALADSGLRAAARHKIIQLENLCYCHAAEF